ncbi:MAG: SGNH/GDSL hydrolase family protein [Chloroflexi bacterium]|nr:MAG: SGNH/GDSL hydrolase family protein [Chloroflexota bacterium]
MRSEPVRYVALGDSYTIGTSVAASERWPIQLVERLGGAGRPLQLAANLAVNGFTSGDVLAVEVPRLVDLRTGFVTLLVGVNDVVQGVPEATYRANLELILDALERSLPIGRIVTVTTPDYTVTPAGADYGEPDARRAGIVRLNAILEETARGRGVALVDIFDVSTRAASERSLVADDGLHPSGAQYALWVDRIAPVVERLLAVRP